VIGEPPVRLAGHWVRAAKPSLAAGKVDSLGSRRGWPCPDLAAGKGSLARGWRGHGSHRQGGGEGRGPQPLLATGKGFAALTSALVMAAMASPTTSEAAFARSKAWVRSASPRSRQSRLAKGLGE